MKIKDYKCKCGHNDFFFADKGNQKGIYCTNCGKWFKWADKDEQNLAMKQELSRKKGKWIDIKSTEYKEFSVTDMKCDCCNRYASLVLPHRTTCTYDYCPNCGADMRGAEDEM